VERGARAMTDDELRQLKTKMTIGSTVIEEGDDPNDPDQIGVIVEPTPIELVAGKVDYCGFDEDPNPYVLVAWSWPETPTEVFDWCWEFVEDLQPTGTGAE